MTLKRYINFYSILQIDKSAKEERRAFGLEMKESQDVTKLLSWEKKYRIKLKKPLLSETLYNYLYGVTLTLVLLAFVFGLIAGATLLHYTGKAPVNVVYFMAMVILLPLFTMVLAFISMLRSNNLQSVLVHLSPAYWLEKLMQFLPHKVQKNLKDYKIPPLLANWLVIKRSQWISLFFSAGLLFSLLGVVATQDIAFAWSTTLDVSPKSLKCFSDTVALPWSSWLPSAVPNLELIEQSQYFRLGDRLSKEMLTHASSLGEWWKFLAMSTLFYAICLRFLMFLLARYGYKKALEKSFLSLNGVKSLLHDMNEPIISTVADEVYETYEKSSTNVSLNMPNKHKKKQRESETYMVSLEGELQVVPILKSNYDMIQGWSISHAQLTVINDSMKLEGQHIFEVGGSNSFSQDSDIIEQSTTEVLLYVKAWEPPTMDFMDYLDELLEVAEKVVVYPIGIQERGYDAKANFVDIWARKLSSLSHSKVWFKYD